MSGVRASFAGPRAPRSRLRPWATPGPRGGGIFSTFPANVTQIETGASNPPGAALSDLPHDLQRRPALRLPVRDLDGGATGRGRRGARARREPEAAPSSVVRLMKQTACRSGGWTTELGWGIVNAEAAVRRALELAQDTVPPRTSRRGVRNRRAGREFTLRWRGRDPAPPGVTPGRHRVLHRLRQARRPLPAPRDHDRQPLPLPRQARQALHVPRARRDLRGQRRALARQGEFPRARAPSASGSRWAASH